VRGWMQTSKKSRWGKNEHSCCS